LAEETTMPVSSMNHFTILTDDVPRTVSFYGELLGLEDGERPPFGFPGAWLYAGGAPILHVIGGRPRDELRAGVIDHMAFTAQGLGATVAKLKARGIDYDLRRLVGRSQWQLFFYDPNGARVELDFDAAEPEPA
jgi:catechol 2,3-dioxygenase-like lactoylglutathione lyase family enzyme